MASSKDLPPLKVPFFPNIFVRNQYLTKPQHPPKTTNLSGKVAVVTGANVGLGFESARQLLSYHLSHLIMAVRSTEKGQTSASNLRKQYPEAVIEVWPLDMCSYGSIQAFIQRTQALTRLDIVILNAGIISLNHNIVPGTGHEETIQVNYLSTAFLAILLLPILKSKSPEGTPGRLTIVNAALSLTSKFPDVQTRLLRSLDDPRNFSVTGTYHISKGLAHMFLYKLVEYVSAEDVVVNLADPGYVKGTEFARGVKSKIILALTAVFEALTARTLEDGASTYLDGCLVKGKESHGCFLMSWRIQPFHTFLYTPRGKSMIEMLWEETLDEFAFADVRGILESMRK